MAFAEDIFDVRQWIQSPPPTYTINGPLSGWTKTSANTYKHGDNGGLSKLQLPTSFPLDLDQWKGDRYIPSHCDGAGVEIIIRELRMAFSEITTSAFHIVTFRNNLNKILGTLIDQREDWIIDGCMYNNSSTLYLDIVKVKSDFEETKDGQRFIRWGRAFEAACTGEHVADSNQEYGMVLSSTLGGIKLCIGAEIDCYDDDGGKEEGKELRRLSSLVELKTFRLPSHAKQWQTVYRWKHPKWWVQSYLAGVERLVLGSRDKQGFITEIHELPTEALHGISQQNGCNNWHPEQLLAFGESVLEWMRGVASYGQHVRFTYSGGMIKSKVMSEESMGGLYLPKRLEKLLSGGEKWGGKGGHRKRGHDGASRERGGEREPGNSAVE